MEESTKTLLSGGPAGCPWDHDPHHTKMLLSICVFSSPLASVRSFASSVLCACLFSGFGDFRFLCRPDGVTCIGRPDLKDHVVSADSEETAARLVRYVHCLSPRITEDDNPEVLGIDLNVARSFCQWPCMLNVRKSASNVGFLLC